MCRGFWAPAGGGRGAAAADAVMSFVTKGVRIPDGGGVQAQFLKVRPALERNPKLKPQSLINPTPTTPSPKTSRPRF